MGDLRVVAFACLLVIGVVRSDVEFYGVKLFGENASGKLFGESFEPVDDFSETQSEIIWEYVAYMRFLAAGSMVETIPLSTNVLSEILDVMVNGDSIKEKGGFLKDLKRCVSTLGITSEKDFKQKCDRWDNEKVDSEECFLAC